MPPSKTETQRKQRLQACAMTAKLLAPKVRLIEARLADIRDETPKEKKERREREDRRMKEKEEEAAAKKADEPAKRDPWATDDTPRGMW